jgi:hypothetical protein
MIKIQGAISVARNKNAHLAWAKSWVQYPVLEKKYREWHVAA